MRKNIEINQIKPCIIFFNSFSYLNLIYPK